MTAILFFIAAFFAGDRISSLFLPEFRKKSSTAFWVRCASAFGTGTLFLGWLTYFSAWAFYRVGGKQEPLKWANLLVIGTVFAWLAIYVLVCAIRKKPVAARPGEGKPGIGETFFFLLLAVFLTFIMFYVFRVRDNVMFSGYTVFSDYSPHTAMIRSFSHENNYPTQYPHFGGEDIRYHFMFQFLVGNLEYLGMRIDYAYNVPSILSLFFFLVMLAMIAKRLGAGLKGQILTVLLFLFRSGTAFFRFVYEHLQAGDLLRTLRNNSVFIGYTPNENWGLWNFNVYLNQRHLAFGLLIGSLVIWTCLDWLIRSCPSPAPPVGRMLKDTFFSAEAWKWKEPERALFIGYILGSAAFWNGAAVIGTLLILAGFGLFSRHKLDYFLLACAAVFVSVLQSRIFIRGDAVSPALQFGFIAEDKTLIGILWYLAQITGFVFLGMLIYLFVCSRVERVLIISFLLPVVFTFCFSLTTDITVNHKYIMIAYAFITVLWSLALTKLWRKGKGFRVLIPLLLVCLMATGIYDFVVILRNNGWGHEVGVPLDSELTRWLNEHLDSDDLLLSPQYAINEVTLSGCMMYCGWLYYSWSAGYDTAHRSPMQKIMYSTYQVNTLKDTVREEGITYILYEDGMTIEEQECREDVIARAFPKVFENDYIRIYEVTE